ncbi:GIY-YIG nuclease family protein [Nostoc sp. NIES-2111]
MDLAQILVSRLRAWGICQPENRPGVYAYALAAPRDLIPSSGERLIVYVGMTAQTLAERCHIDHEHSGRSTLRRSLGALLRDELKLTPQPRAFGPSRSNTTNYRFDPDGEARLTAWMKAYLLYADFPLTRDLHTTERDLIRDLEPPLNLRKWANPHRGVTEALRAACAQDARLWLLATEPVHV